MPTISLTISAGELTRTVDALSIRFGYKDLLEDGSENPQTKGEFVRLQIARWVKEQVKEHELNTARAAIDVTSINIT